MILSQPHQQVCTPARTGSLNRVQERDLKSAGCTKLFSEQVSSVASRDKLKALLDFVRDSDAIVVTKPGRLARSTAELLATAVRLEDGARALHAAVGRRCQSGNHQANAAANARQLHAAKARESRGDVALTQLRYGEAAGHFGAAVSLLPDRSYEEKGRLLFRQAGALYRQGDEFSADTSA